MCPSRLRASTGRPRNAASLHAYDAQDREDGQGAGKGGPEPLAAVRGVRPHAAHVDGRGPGDHSPGCDSGEQPLEQSGRGVNTPSLNGWEAPRRLQCHAFVACPPPMDLGNFTASACKVTSCVLQVALAPRSDRGACVRCCDVREHGCLCHPLVHCAAHWKH
eukprot:35104-Chlamydomonas_euryale.AAC.5